MSTEIIEKAEASFSPVGKLLTRSFREKTSDEKKAEWAEKIKIRTEQWSDIFKAAKPHKQDEIMRLYTAETETGICPLCKHRWREIEFENKFGYVHFFEPACDCYPKCPNCSKHHRFPWLYQEFVAGQLYVFGSNTDLRCSHCGWMLIKHGKKRFGLQYELEQFEADYKQEWHELSTKNKTGKDEEL